MAFVALYDANVLYPNTLRDLLIRIAQSGLVQAKWTDEVLDEVFRNLTKNRSDIDDAKLARLRSLMNDSIPDVLVTDFEPLISALELPDPPRAELGRWGIEAKRPDDFVPEQIDRDVKVVYACVQQIVDSRKRSPETVDDVLRQLERSGLVETSAALRTG